MADTQQDLFNLQYSSSFDIQGLQEADINLNLTPSSGTQASVFGVVTDGQTPIPNATVKLFDRNGVPFRHTMTDTNGAYAMDGVPIGTYTIAAVKDGYRLSDAAGLTLSQGSTLEIPLLCTPDLTLNLGAIAGVLSVTGNGAGPLGGAKITLMATGNVAISSTYTADDGEFVFYDVADGSYTLIASSEGYLPAAPVTVEIVGGSIANVSMTMTADQRTYNGTVSGIITDQNGVAVSNCFVGLYRVDSLTKTETLIATTKTNAAGKYLFGGVTAGSYLVKAKQSL